MKRYKKKKLVKLEVSEPILIPRKEKERIEITHLGRDELVCPGCGRTNSLFIIARERNYYNIDGMTGGRRYGACADWGNVIDGDADEHWIACDHCNEEYSEEQVWEVSVKCLREAEDEAV